MLRVIAALLLASASIPAFGAEPSLTLTMNARGVTIANVSPGGRAVVFSSGRIPFHGYGKLYKFADVAGDDDRDGTITIDTGKEIPLRSVWFAVDLTTGSSATAAPSGFRMQRASFGRKGAVPDNQGQIKKLQHSRPSVDVVFARPGLGAWELSASEGSYLNVDRGHGFATNIAASTPIGTSPAAPTHLVKGDVVIVVDSLVLDFDVFEVGAKE